MTVAAVFLLFKFKIGKTVMLICFLGKSPHKLTISSIASLNAVSVSTNIKGTAVVTGVSEEMMGMS